MKLWIDDVRPAPEGYEWEKTVIGAQMTIRIVEAVTEVVNEEKPIEVIDIDHDAGSYALCGGDYIELLNWLEQTGRNYPIHIHSMNPVGVQNMRAIIQRNGWKEV